MSCSNAACRPCRYWDSNTSSLGSPATGLATVSLIEEVTIKNRGPLYGLWNSPGQEYSEGVHMEVNMSTIMHDAPVVSIPPRLAGAGQLNRSQILDATD